MIVTVRYLSYLFKRWMAPYSICNVFCILDIQ